LGAAKFRVTLGTFLEEQKKPNEAEAAYRAALDLLEKVVADHAAPASAHQQLANTASVLAWLLLESKPAEAEGLLQRCLRELREPRPPKPDNREDTRGLWAYSADLPAFYKRRGQHAQLANLANQPRGVFLGEPDHTYTAARFLPDAVRVVPREQGLPPP